MEDKQRIEEKCARIGLTVKEWRDDPNDGITAVLGRFECNTDEFEDDGIYSGTVGVVEASVVGAAQYHNQRVWFGYKEDGTDSGQEIDGQAVVDCLDAA